MKMRDVGRRSSKEGMLGDPSLQKKKSSFSAEELDDEELDGMGDSKPVYMFLFETSGSTGTLFRLQQ